MSFSKITELKKSYGTVPLISIILYAYISCEGQSSLLYVHVRGL